MRQISRTIYTYTVYFFSLQKPEKIPHFAWLSLWTGSGWEGLAAAGGAEKELVESEMAEWAWGREWGGPSPIPFPLPSHPLFAPSLTRESVQSLGVTV